MWEHQLGALNAITIFIYTFFTPNEKIPSAFSQENQGDANFTFSKLILRHKIA